MNIRTQVISLVEHSTDHQSCEKDKMAAGSNKTIAIENIFGASHSPTVAPGTFSNSQINTLSYFYLVTSALSLIGSFSIVVAAIAKRKVSNKEVHPVFHLSLADLFGSIILLAGAISYHFLKYNTATRESCRILTGFASAFYMNTFLLTLNYARSIYQKVQRRSTGLSIRRLDESGGHFQRIGVTQCSAQLLWYGFAWFIPLLVTLCLFAIDHTQYGPNDNICTSCLPMFHWKNSNCQRISDPNYKNEPEWYEIYKWIFIVILTLSLLGSVTYNMMAYRVFKAIQIHGGVISKPQRHLLKVARRRLGLFCVTFLFCWTPSLLLGFISIQSTFQMTKLYWLYIVQACTCPLQGFLNCIIYGWYRPGFKNAITEKTPLLRPTSVQSEV
eukprot:Seg1692.5 transcript_id=Seg1692.5/GoldUCD/mRNA.D3Y31 product="Transmembrane protein 116" protein_id=Seg1692.5/GoldUCD/D3Y31